MSSLEIFPPSAPKFTEFAATYVVLSSFEQLLRSVFKGIAEISRVANENTRTIRIEHDRESVALAIKLAFVRERINLSIR